MEEAQGELVKETVDEVVNDTEYEVVNGTDGEVVVKETEGEVVKETEGEAVKETVADVVVETVGELADQPLARAVEAFERRKYRSAVTLCEEALEKGWYGSSPGTLCVCAQMVEDKRCNGPAADYLLGQHCTTSSFCT